MLVYATGDVGWFWKDRELFDRVAAFGYPAVGFSSREYLRHLGRGTDVIRSGVLAADYSAMIRAARQALGLTPGTRIVLVGKSRGAGLAIAAAGEPSLRRRLQGVIAVGLTRVRRNTFAAGSGADRRKRRCWTPTPRSPP